MSRQTREAPRPDFVLPITVSDGARLQRADRAAAAAADFVLVAVSPVFAWLLGCAICVNVVMVVGTAIAATQPDASGVTLGGILAGALYAALSYIVVSIWYATTTAGQAAVIAVWLIVGTTYWCVTTRLGTPTLGALMVQPRPRARDGSPSAPATEPLDSPPDDGATPCSAP